MLHRFSLLLCYRSSLDNLSRERRDAPAAPAFADKSQHQLTDGMTEVKSILKQMQATQYANNQVCILVVSGLI